MGHNLTADYKEASVFVMFLLFFVFSGAGVWRVLVFERMGDCVITDFGGWEITTR